MCCVSIRRSLKLQSSLYPTSQRSIHQRKIIDMTINGSGCRASPHIIGIGLNTIFRRLKNSVPSQ
ncbi:TPA: hypothetical protein OUG33_005146 [Klebsiella pneumoniae]|nr:hypothetical protein [Klebsiella pneumoniae]